MKIYSLVLLYLLQVNPVIGQVSHGLTNSPKYIGSLATAISGYPEKTQLYFNCSGMLAQVYVHKGEKFKKGTLLASLEYQDVNAATIRVCFFRNQARAAYSSVSARADKKKATVSELERAKKMLSDADVNYEKSISGGQSYFIIAAADGRVIGEPAKAGNPVSAGETILIVK